MGSTTTRSPADQPVTPGPTPVTTPVGADEGGLHRPTPAGVAPQSEPCRSNVVMG